MPITPSGQGAMQAPQPVQVLRLISGWEKPPITSLKEMAPASHASPQERHITPLAVKHPSKRKTLSCQGGFLVPSRAPLWQALTHSAQNVQAPYWKSTTGSRPLPNRRIFSGQASIHLPQLSQVSSNSDSGMAQGGLMGVWRPQRSP